MRFIDRKRKSSALVATLIFVVVFSIYFKPHRDSPGAVLNGCVALGLMKSSFIDNMRGSGYGVQDGDSTRFESINGDGRYLIVRYDWTGYVVRATGQVDSVQFPDRSIIVLGQTEQYAQEKLGKAKERRQPNNSWIELEYPELHLILGFYENKFARATLGQ